MSKLNSVILLHKDDNVLVCTNTIVKGEIIKIDNAEIIALSDIETGHKIARFNLKAGDKIFKYGAPIGSMKLDTKIGEHVHMHNLNSDYIPTHLREDIS